METQLNQKILRVREIGGGPNVVKHGERTLTFYDLEVTTVSWRTAQPETFRLRLDIDQAAALRNALALELICLEAAGNENFPIATEHSGLKVAFVKADFQPTH
jgi:hypothetical protein